ncbi:unnamed protein product [Didymodactylos carnosus]|uniref:Uncharacterized protein n=1 Tax=Didymodactylos carnosus TaxID=1234261 RepID=A0A814U691_9BILA|nr:unnamed protein product [Didymodactylos carnosus]CAF1167776.1 unnamed protein product [Didymodactylos carnosus]CAF3745310.1 unnamed protein product [Didymodactylos carnosus]CAF3931410.1 unnamed protein product [Didymodactylos carnosus]
MKDHGPVTAGRDLAYFSEMNEKLESIGNQMQMLIKGRTFQSSINDELMAKLNELNETSKQCDLPNGGEVLSEDKLSVAKDDGISIHELAVIKTTEEKYMQTDLQMRDITNAISKGADVCGFVAPLNVFDKCEYDVSSSSSENQVDISSIK